MKRKEEPSFFCCIRGRQKIVGDSSDIIFLDSHARFRCRFGAQFFCEEGWDIWTLMQPTHNFGVMKTMCFIGHVISNPSHSASSEWNQYEQNGVEENTQWQDMLNNQYGAVAEQPVPVNQANIPAYGSTYPLPDMGTSYYNVYNVPIQQLALSNAPEPYASMQIMGFKRYEAAAAAVKNRIIFGSVTFDYWVVEQDFYYPLPSHFIDMKDFE